MAYNNIFNIWFRSRDEKPIHIDERRRKKGFLDAVEKNSYIILIIIVIGSIILKSLNITGGLLIGGIIAILNFKGLRFILERIIKGREVIFYGVLLAMKFFLLTSLIFFNIIYIKINSVSFVIGLSVIFIAIIMQSIISYLREEDI